MIGRFFKTIGLAKPSQKELKIDREEAFPDSVHFPQELQPIVLDYLNGEITDTSSTPEQRQKFTLFGRNIQTLQVPYVATLAAERMVWCDADGVEDLVEKNPSILKYVIPEVRDPWGRILENKTLLQIAGAMGDFNFREMESGEKPYGMVERLARYLPPDEVAKQLSEQFPVGWEAETDKRMQAYYTALTTFTESLINMPLVPLGSTLEAECKSIIETYRDSLNSAANQKVGAGLIFSPEIFVMARKYYRQKKSSLGGQQYSRNLFFDIGYSGLQQRASGDAPIIKHGIYNVVKEGEIPNRSLTFASGRPYYSIQHSDSDRVSLAEWGFFINTSWKVASLDEVIWFFDSTLNSGFEELMASKKKRIAEFIKQPDNTINRETTRGCWDIFRCRP